ncbi:Endopolyphosphatase, partial [Cryphonectria parasitica EP155]
PVVGSQQSRKLHGRFLHVTDFHPDEFYKAHSSTAADHACHSGKGTAGTYGAETSDCDTPISLINATFDWISANIRDEIDFVVWTGDNARHDSDESIPRSADQVLGTNRLLASKFADTFSDANGLTIPVIPTFGNNDILPHNILLPGPNKWLAYYADIWRDYIPEAQRHSFEFGGWFYVEVIPNKLAVFSLNTLYFFDRNAAIDDCVKPSEPGFKHLEWLRVQLQFMRDRGMKAILMGHVPPARTDSKTLWDETCWQKYTLWLRQYRDVVITGLYGHMNIDHFLLSDAKEITIDSTEAEDVDLDFSHRQDLDDELTIQSATDYLEELRDGWAKLPKVKLNDESEQKSKKKKKKKDKSKKKLGGKWAERYQLSFVGPSVVPNYFPTLRVFEYNITGIEDAVTWAENTEVLPTIDSLRYGEDDEEGFVQPELELRNSHDAETAKKKKKKKKGKGDKKPKDPNLVVPKPPAKSSPPGPAYSSQPLTLLGYTQYFANLTYINNDIAPEEHEAVGPEKWREGKHHDKKPKNSTPKPRTFEFELEYATHDDKLYNLSDLTVRNFVDLAYKMGQTAKSKTADLFLQRTDTVDDLVQVDQVEGQNPEILNESEVFTDDENDVEELADDGIDAQKKKSDKKKKKKKKKKAKKLNKTWLHFLKHAFISTVDDEQLEE